MQSQSLSGQYLQRMRAHSADSPQVPAASQTSVCTAGTTNRIRPSVLPPLRSVKSANCFPEGFGAALPVAQQPMPEATFSRLLTQWVRGGAVDEWAGRMVAAARMREARTQSGASLDLQDLKLSSLPDCLHGLTRLEQLDASGNRLGALPALPKKLTRLTVAGNRLTALPDLPDTLECLVAHDNPHMTLPTLPASLLRLQLDAATRQAKIDQLQAQLAPAGVTTTGGGSTKPGLPRASNCAEYVRLIDLQKQLAIVQQGA